MPRAAYPLAETLKDKVVRVSEAVNTPSSTGHQNGSFKRGNGHSAADFQGDFPIEQLTPSQCPFRDFVLRIAGYPGCDKRCLIFRRNNARPVSTAEMSMVVVAGSGICNETAKSTND